MMPEEPQSEKGGLGLTGKSLTLSKPRSYHSRNLHASPHLTPTVVCGGRGKVRETSLKTGLLSSLRRTPTRLCPTSLTPFPSSEQHPAPPAPVHWVPWTPCIPSAALGEPQLCYILDAILFLYGIVLTLLYCRLKVRRAGAGLRTGPQSGRVAAAGRGTEGVLHGLEGKEMGLQVLLY